MKAIFVYGERNEWAETIHSAADEVFSEVFRLPVRGDLLARRLRLLPVYPMLVLRLLRLLSVTDAEIVFCAYGGRMATSCAVAKRIARTRCRLLIFAAGSDVLALSRLGRSLAARVYRSADLVLANGERLREETTDMSGSRLVRNWQHGVDAGRVPFCPAGPLNRIVVTRRLEPIYDNETIVRAIALLKWRHQTELHLDFAGSGSQRLRLETLAVELRVSDQITFRDGYQPSEIAEVLSPAGIYVSAALSDGTSNSLLEAVLAGMRVVVSATPANLEWIGEDRVHGWTFPVGSADSMAKAILAAQTASGWYSQAEINRAHVLKHGDANSAGDRLCGVLADHGIS